MPTADERDKPSFFQQKPVVLQPKELVPDGTDMVQLTDSIVASAAQNAKEREDSLAALQKQEFDIACARARAEIADNKLKAAKAQEDAKKKAWHDDVARRNLERDARKEEARQRELKNKISKLASDCTEAIAVLEEIKDKNCVSVRLLRDAMKEFENFAAASEQTIQ